MLRQLNVREPKYWSRRFSWSDRRAPEQPGSQPGRDSRNALSRFVKLEKHGIVDSLYLAVGVMDLKGHSLPLFQFEPLGINQLGAVLVFADEPGQLLSSDRVPLPPRVEMNRNKISSHLLVRNLTARADLPTALPPAITILEFKIVSHKDSLDNEAKLHVDEVTSQQLDKLAL